MSPHVVKEAHLVPVRTQRISDRMPAPGTLLCERYRLGPLVGRGGAAAVYRGTDEVLDEIVAIKVLLPDGIMNHPRAAHLSFRAEAVSAMRLSHPRILRVYNYEVQPPWEFLIMEFVAGENLAKVVKTLPDGRLTAVETVDVGIGCLEALEAAHAEGIVHNDLTPSNVLLTRAGTIKLCDFGLARFAAAEMPERTMSAIGTPAFMSPERITGASGDARSDLYSLAATLFALGEGESMFGSDAEAYYHHVHTPPPDARYLPAALSEVLRVAAAKDPGERFQSAQEMRLALTAVRRLVVGSGSGAGSHAPARAPSAPPPVLRDIGEESLVSPTDLDDAFDDGVDIVIGEDSAAHVGGGAEAVPVAVREPRSAAQTAEAARAAAAHAASPAQGAPAPHGPPAARAPAPARAPSPPARPGFDTRGMVEVPAVILTSSFGGVYAVKGFLLDRLLVTNEQYAEFVRVTGESPPAHWLGGRPPASLMKHPVVGVTRAQAARFAELRGKRLPTALEWEAAARGAGGRRFPWGDVYDPAFCQGPERSAGETAPVGQHAEGASSFGVLDLIGNVWEWTIDDPHGQAPEAGYAWVFGGSFKHRCDPEDRLARTTVAIGKSYEYLGFRCAAEEGKHVRR